MNLRSRAIIIFLVMGVASVLVWPNLAERTLLIYLYPNLKETEAEASIVRLKSYLKSNYPSQYKVEVEEQAVREEISEEEVKRIIEQGKQVVRQEKEKVIKIKGRFIQAAFINEMGRLEHVDGQRSTLKPLWIEEKMKARPFKLGLDLQGGMNLLLEADFEKLLSQLKEQYSPEFISEMNEKIAQEKDEDEKQKLTDERDRALDLLDITPEKKKEYVEGALEIIRSRIDKTGVSEPSIRLQGEDKIEISLPGVASPEQAKKIIKSTAQVGYHLVEEDPAPYTSLAGKYFERYVSLESEISRRDYLKEVEKKINLPNQYKLYVFWGKERGDPTDTIRPSYFMVLEKQKSLSGDHISPNTYVSFNPDTLQNMISFQLTPEGGKVFGELTTKNTGRRMAIVIDEKVRSAPNINEPILGGSAQISGDFTPQEAKDLALIIKEGALPVPMNIVQERSIGPTLGKESIEKGVYAVFWGFIVVAIFVALYYHVAGLITNVILLLNLIFMSAILALMDFTITLPGLAGVVLTLGMAVDANVIIYERIREEIGRGKSMKVAVGQGFERATLAIVDSNLTTVIAAIVLSQFGIGPIKGFAVTLFIGILSSLFTSLFITKTIFYWFVHSMNIKSVPMGWGIYQRKALKERTA